MRKRPERREAVPRVRTMLAVPLPLPLPDAGPTLAAAGGCRGGSVTPGVDPGAWADAAIRLFAGGGWVVPALVALYVVCRWPPWRKEKG